MSKYQYSKLVMEKFLRRSFYDAVLELYETAQGTRIISVSLEGNLSLVVNKDESFVIKLNEIAQRADDREDHQQRYKDMGEMKLEESMDRYVVKKEEYQPHTAESVPSSLANEIINLDPVAKESEKHVQGITLDPNKMDTSYDDLKNKYSDGSDDKLNESKGESDSYEKSSDGESESDDDGDPELPMTFHPHAMLPVENQHKAEVDTSGGEDICFLPVGQVDEFKRKLEYKDHEQTELQGKKSPRKRRKTASSTDGDDDGMKADDKVGTSTASVDEVGTGGLQLLPHTATGPIIVEEDDSSYNNGMTESQMAQLAMFQ
ncbi:unnamed protein product, partial [Lymnaea stagnalis]